MAELRYKERRALELLFQMGGGHVLDFSHKTLGEFVWDCVRRDIHDAQYSKDNSGSKANLVRKFWDVEPAPLVANLIEALIDEAAELPDASSLVVSDCRAAVERLRTQVPVADLDALDIAGSDVEQLFAQVRHAVQNEEPEAALDRLHTLMMRFGRQLCSSVELVVDRKTPLNGVFGAYFKWLREHGYVRTKMTQSILSTTVGVLDAFNDVRNNHTLAHDNPTLDRSESLLIVNHLASTVRFLRTMYERVSASSESSRAKPGLDGYEDIEF